MTRIVAIVPAAGSGSRMGEALPKQYQLLNGVPMIVHTLAALAGVPRIERIVAVLAPDDRQWDDALARPSTVWPPALGGHTVGGRMVAIRTGGTTRAASVAAGLAAVAAECGPDDWALVHDAARPCLRREWVDRLIDTLADDPVGGLLALPVADTVKSAGDDRRVDRTVDRSTLWRAQTPQLFRLGLLRAALAAMPEATDEAQAVEALGHRPRLVPGDHANIKVTYPADLKMAGMLLAAEEKEGRT